MEIKNFQKLDILENTDTDSVDNDNNILFNFLFDFHNNADRKNPKDHY
jgi:hypothetical protein